MAPNEPIYATRGPGNHFVECLYLQVTPIETHPVDLPTVRPGRVHPVDELLLVVKVDVDDVVEALRNKQQMKSVTLR